MSREARVVAEGVPHHITQRGNNRQDVFLLDEDRRFYIEALRGKSQQHSLTVLGYCLMTNHVHLVAIPRQATSLARARGRRAGATGCASEGALQPEVSAQRSRVAEPLDSCPLGPSHLVTALAYVDLNPKPLGIKAWQANPGLCPTLQ